MLTENKTEADRHADRQMKNALHVSKLNHHAQVVRDLQHYIRGFVAAGGQLRMQTNDIDEALEYSYMLLVGERLKTERPQRQTVPN